jgi:hypothetical protein
LAPGGRKRDELEQWLIHLLPERFDGRIVPVERHAADPTGRILARSRKEGWEMESMDALIGATAMVNDMALATLNRRHFQRLGVELVKFCRFERDSFMTTELRMNGAPGLGGTSVPLPSLTVCEVFMYDAGAKILHIDK